MKEAIVNLFLTCNYNCSYCWQYRQKTVSTPMGRAGTLEGMSSFIDFFNKRGEWLIALTGGEVTLHPYFLEMSKELTKNHYLRIISNTSIGFDKLRKFVAMVNPQKIDYWWCSFQEKDEEPQRFKELIEKLKFLRKSGINVLVGFVATPQRLKSVPEYHDLFISNGIPFLVSPFEGKLDSLYYPTDYTKEEKNILDKYIVSIVNKNMVDNLNYSCLGQLCDAGYEKINIEYNGDIYKCMGDKRKVIGNVYTDELTLSDKPEKCQVNGCGCMFPIELDSLVKENYRYILENCPQQYNKELFAQYTEKLGSFQVQARKILREEQEQRVKDIFRDLAGKNVGIYGTSTHTEVLLNVYKAYIGDINFNLFFFDSDETRWGTNYHGKAILRPEMLKTIDLDSVIISSFSFQNDIYSIVKKYVSNKVSIVKIYKEDEHIIFNQML